MHRIGGEGEKETSAFEMVPSLPLCLKAFGIRFFQEVPQKNPHLIPKNRPLTETHFTKFKPCAILRSRQREGGRI